MHHQTRNYLHSAAAAAAAALDVCTDRQRDIDMDTRTGGQARTCADTQTDQCTPRRVYICGSHVGREASALPRAQTTSANNTKLPGSPVSPSPTNHTPHPNTDLLRAEDLDAPGHQCVAARPRPAHRPFLTPMRNSRDRVLPVMPSATVRARPLRICQRTVGDASMRSTRTRRYNICLSPCNGCYPL